jgi:uncharacterized membrane protein YqjE
MPVVDRSFSDVLQSIVGNIQEIVRAELRLAKTEIREEAVKAKSASIFLGTGAAIAVFATLFLLLAIIYALALVIPIWAAALIVGAALAVTATMMLMAGVRRFKQIHPTPERTVESIKENFLWAKQHTK